MPASDNFTQNKHRMKDNVLIKEHKSFFRKYGAGVAVLCKCPYCGEKHLVTMKTAPVVMPRIYCPDHKTLRKIEPGGYSYDDIGQARKRKRTAAS